METDYTKYRKGKREEGHTIELCPSCGLKGLYFPEGKFASGEVRPAYWLHLRTKRGEYWEMTRFCVAR